jgi:hypothetical protein
MGRWLETSTAVMVENFGGASALGMSPMMAVMTGSPPPSNNLAGEALV